MSSGDLPFEDGVKSETETGRKVDNKLENADQWEASEINYKNNKESIDVQANVEIGMAKKRASEAGETGEAGEIVETSETGGNGGTSDATAREDVDARKKFKTANNGDVSDAFSRREMHYNKTVRPTSIYEGEKRETPAWMVSKSTDKYDKYGSRRGTEAIGSVEGGSNEKEDRYSKYLGGGGRSREVKRGIRSSESSDPYSEYRRPKSAGGVNQRQDEEDEEETLEAAPYSNIDVANPSANMYQTFQSHIRDKEEKDINSIVRAHYNQRTIQSKYQGSRTKSPIYKLRNFNNAIKYILLNNFVKKTPGKPTVVLDLCCGKGGDLNKFEFVSIEQYIGIDISDASIKEAFSRYSKNKARFIPRHSASRDSRRYNFDACFATGDCFSNSIPDILEPNFPGIVNSLFPVDTVSIQFSMHYSFETEDKVKTMLTNVTRSLRPGGTFIGTIPSSDFIRDKILKKDFIGDRKFGNDLYSVTFEKDPPENGVFRPPFGNKYDYYLQDAVDNVPEYVVPFEAFRSLCEDYGLVMKYKKNFIDIFNSEIPRYFNKLNKNLIEGMRRADGKFGAEGSQKEAVAFYIGFVFEKLGN